MVYKITISDGTVLQKSIESVSFEVDPPNDFDDMYTYTINSIRIKGKIGIDEDITVLSNWSLIPANNPMCYKELILEQTLADQIIRKIVFSKAFVVSYKESYTDDTGIGQYSLFIRQLATIDIECTNGQSSVQAPSKENIFNQVFNVPKSAFDHQIMSGQAGKPDYFELTEKGVREELSKSKMGRETLKYIDDNNVPVLLSYELKKSRMGNLVSGHYDPEFDVCRIFVLNTLFYEETAKTVIHEITHYMGYRQTKYFEFLARYREEKHVHEGRVPLSVMRKHYEMTFTSGEYDKLSLGIPNGKRKRLEKKGLIESVRR